MQNCLTRDGQNSPSANISWAGYKITSLGAPSSGGDAANKTYVDSGAYLGTALNGLSSATAAALDLLVIADVDDSNNPKKVTVQSVVEAGIAAVPDNTIPTDKLTFAATDKLLGRSTSGAGAGEEITCTAAGRALLDDADATAQRATLGIVAASDTVAGLVELATTAEVQTGTDTARAITPAAARAALPFSRTPYESSEISLSSGAQSVLAHGFSIQPRLVMAYLRCKTAEGNYSVNDEVIVPMFGTGGGTAFYMSVVTDSTNITVRQMGGFSLANKSTVAYFTVTPGNWALIIRAFA